MRVFGLWNGGGSYGLADMATDGETWSSLASAKASLVARYASGDWLRDRNSRVVDVDENDVARPGVAPDVFYPAVTEDCSIDLYASERVGRDGWRVSDVPWARLTLGPRGGVRVEKY